VGEGMKKILILLILLFLISSAAVYGSDLNFTISVDWQMSVQGGVEYRFNDYFGMKADLGVSIMGLLNFDLFAMIDTIPEDNPWCLSLLIGVPNLLVPLTFNAATVSFGGAVLVGRQLSDAVQLNLRIGAGFPLFFESGTEMIRDISFPFDLWPEFVLEISFL
jgi:hypothetical protein